MEDKWKSKIVYAAATLLGALCFFAVYGVRVLNPLYDDWLLGRGDLTQHYLGWCFYRQGAWTFPLGLTDRLAYPDYSSVIFTDSIPLLAIVFKLLSPVLPETCQYFGWWGLGCFMLQGFFAAKLLDRLRVGSLQVLAGSVLFILSPVVIEKMFRHTALGGHWIILAAIYLFVCHKELYTDVKKTALYWGLIGAYVFSADVRRVSGRICSVQPAAEGGASDKNPLSAAGCDVSFGLVCLYVSVWRLFHKGGGWKQ